MEAGYNARAYVELFHLLFMEQLSHKLDKRLYALKGGCNLRFFLNSLRYSEDIDIDVQTVAVDTLKKLVHKILTSLPFQQVLQARKISINDFSEPKQTETTQRWKVQLNIPGYSLPINTKIEFSRRGLTSETVTEVISRSLTMFHKIRPIFITHYTAEVALTQKIRALIQRTETQARDVFDSHHLIQTSVLDTKDKFSDAELQTAIKNTTSINFATFKSQVVSYLEPEYQGQYSDPAIWDTMQLTVCDHLGRELA